MVGSGLGSLGVAACSRSRVALGGRCSVVGIGAEVGMELHNLDSVGGSMGGSSRLGVFFLGGVLICHSILDSRCRLVGCRELGVGACSLVEGVEVRLCVFGWVGGGVGH